MGGRMREQQFTKKQHYVSQGLLRLFSEDDTHIYECLTRDRRIYKTNIANAMEERDTYEYPLLKENTLENAFADIEAAFIPQVCSIVADVDLTGGNATDIYKRVSALFEIFLLFYYRSGAVLSEFSYGIEDTEVKKRLRIRRLLEVITTRAYLTKLANSLRCGYSFSILYSAEGQFIISDQYISTVALAYKNQFMNTSNRSIGMTDTMILLPLSSSFYIALFHGKAPSYIKANQACELTPNEVFEINRIIYQNSFNKCAAPKASILEALSKEKYSFHGATQVFFETGGYTNKKEIFFYPQDAEIWMNFMQYAVTYKELKSRVGKSHMRNIGCPCGSGKKFKICCLGKYERAFLAIEETQQKVQPSYHIPGCIAEMPIYEFWHE